MGTSGSSNTKKHGNFVEENHCSCCASKLRAIEFWKVEVDSMDRDVKRVTNVGRGALATVWLTASTVVGVGAALVAAPLVVPVALVGGAVVGTAGATLAVKDDMTHNCLEVLYKCDQCGHEVHVTYEILVPSLVTISVRETAGRYSNRYSYPYTKRLYCSGTKMFVDVNRVCGDMWYDFDPVIKNCKMWTNDFINRLGLYG